MEIDEAKKLKLEVEDKIIGLLQDFKNKTKLNIGFLYYKSSENQYGQSVEIKLDARL